MGMIDVIIFIGFIVGVVALGLWKSGKSEKDTASLDSSDAKQNAKDYFLAGGSLPWWVIGFSLIAANISTEQFVGMSGKAADWLGLAIASYEWLAAITLVIVAFLFLPKFLKSGIYTIPEFLEYRYDPISRMVMAIITMIILVGVPTASVIYSGATVMDIFFKGQTLFGLIPITITTSCWIIGLLATSYVFAGGLKACAWADLIQGSALIVGGAIVTWLGLEAIGAADVKTLVAAPDVVASGINGISYINATPDSVMSLGALERTLELNASKFHMVLPSSDKEIPWTALVFFGLWIPNFFYWGLNQYITQRTLGAKSLNEGQKGIIFAAGMKLIIPFIVVIIGIMAFNLYSTDLQQEGRWKSAVTLASAPALHAKLSEKFSPSFIQAEDSARSEHIVTAINETLTASSALSGEILFAFDPVFATAYPGDAAKIYAHNYQFAVANPSVIADSVYSPAEVMVLADSVIRTDKKMAAKLAESLVLSNGYLIAKPTPVQKVKSLAGYNFDSTYGTLLQKLVKGKVGIAGFVLAAIFGAVVSSLASMLNSASTIFTMDIFHKCRPKASQFALVSVGRTMTILFVIIACVIAPALGNPAFGGIFTFIQEFQGFISPGVLAIFLFGVLVPKAPRICGLVGLVLNPCLYAFFKWGDWIYGKALGLLNISYADGIHETIYLKLQWIASLSFLDRMSICFVLVLLVLSFLTIYAPLKQPVTLPVNEKMDMSTTFGTKFWGVVVILATLVLYAVFF